MNIRIVNNGDLFENCYLLEKENKYLVIDPGSEFDKIDSYINKDGEVLAILITHRHPDHIGALEDVLNTYRCQLFDYFSTTEDNYKLDGFDFSVVRTRGHTSDSVSYYFYNDKIIFTGDFLFKQSIGRTDLGGNDDDMNRSLHKIRKFPKEIKIYPGHGDDTTLEIELEENPY